MLLKEDVALSRLTSFKCGGVLPRLYYMETVSDLEAFLGNNEPFFVLGKGSNTVIRSGLAQPRVVQLSPDIVPSEVEGTTLRVSAGVPVNRLMSLCVEAGLDGLSFCAGVPASVGGMIAMNFGCWGQEISDCLKRVLVMTETGALEWMMPDTLAFSYRSSIFHTCSWVVVAAEFSLVSMDRDRIKELQHDRIRLRLDKQPLRGATFGSIFKNPPGQFSAQILDELGYRGRSFGSVQISEKHANFMLNLDGASFEDVQATIAHIRADVSQKKGIDLEPEVCFFT